jgi:hypothetical protein
MTNTSKIFFALAWVCASAAAQTDAPVPRNNAIVYKCTDAAGNVAYSQNPCSSDPKKMQTIDTSPALRTGSGGNQGAISAGVADKDCRDRAYQSTHSTTIDVNASNEHIASYQQRQHDLQAYAEYMTSPDARAAYEAGNQKEIEDLNAAIAKERAYQENSATNTEAAYQKALKSCDDELAKSKQQAQKAQEAQEAQH